jgi:5-oxoprolinase (ATP-hydrolysing)
LYSKVVEVDERVTLVGYTSDPKSEEHAIQFDEDGKVIRGYRGNGWDNEGLAEGPGEIIRGISGEAVRVMKKPGMLDVSDQRFPSSISLFRSASHRKGSSRSLL